jgi:hypothetical protein
MDESNELPCPTDPQLIARLVSEAQELLPLSCSVCAEWQHNKHLSYLSLYDVNCPFSQNGITLK